MQEAGELPDAIVGLVLVGWQLGFDGSWTPQIYTEDSALLHWSQGRKVRPVWRLPFV